MSPEESKTIDSWWYVYYELCAAPGHPSIQNKSGPFSSLETAESFLTALAANPKFENGEIKVRP